MKSTFALALAATSLYPYTVATPVYDTKGERFIDDFLNDPVDRVGRRQAPATSAPLPIATGLSYTVPPPKTNGGTAWTAAYQRAANLTAQMTLQEKVNLVTGQNGRYSGNTGGVQRLGIPSICLLDGPAGPSPALGKSQYPSGSTVAATWDRDLIYQRAKAMGQEFYDLGVHTALAPVTGGPLGRSPRMSRLWEGFASDPYLTGEGSYLSVKGITDCGVTATAKHWILYEQETFRNLHGLPEPYSVFPPNQQLPIDSYADDKTTHELYMWPFAEAVRAGTGYVMCSYNMVNGTHACANSQSLNDHLKGELAFSGTVVSDWGGTWGTQAFALGGEDLNMPGNGFGNVLGKFFDVELSQLVSNGSVPQARLDDMVNRVLTPFIAHGQFDKPLPSLPPVNSLGQPTFRQVQKKTTVDLIKKIGEDGAVLLKNIRGALPLKNPHQIAVIGSDAGNNQLGPQSAAFSVGGNKDALYNSNGTMSLGGGSGYSVPNNLISPLTAIQMRALETQANVQFVLNNTVVSGVRSAVTGADAAIVFVQSYAAETMDRANLNLTDGGDALIQAVAAVNNNTIVVMHIPGPVVIDAWVNHPNVTAVFAALLPGEQSGNSIVSVLWGDVSPSGKLPFTISKQESDWPDTIVSTPVVAPKSNFSEGAFVDYRWFQAKGITPRYEFGFGLSYSTFAYSSIGMQTVNKADSTSIQTTNEKFSGQAAGQSLYDTILSVYADVKNTGSVVASEVAQLYIEFPADELQPLKQLRGFEKLRSLKAGETQTATFPLRRKDVMVWDTVLQKWRLPKLGYVKLYVGASSSNLPLSTIYKF